MMMIDANATIGNAVNVNVTLIKQTTNVEDNDDDVEQEITRGK